MYALPCSKLIKPKFQIVECAIKNCLSSTCRIRVNFSRLRQIYSLVSYLLIFFFTNSYYELFYNQFPMYLIHTSRLWNQQRMEKRAQIVFASESNPGDSAQDEKKTSSRSGDGPPFLTILAGLAVLMLIVWIVGSILMWLVGLIVHTPSS